MLSAIAGAQTNLVVAPQQIALVAPEDSGTDAVQTLTVSSIPPNIKFTAYVRDSSAVGGWLSVSPASGETPATLTVSAKPGGLPSGVYTAQIVVAAGALGTVANVVFSVGSSRGPIVVSPTALTFFDQSYTPVFVQKTLDLTVVNSAGQTIPYTARATSIGNWLAVSPFPAAAPGTLTVSGSTTGLDAGTYTGAITILPATGLPTVVPVTLVTAGMVRPATPMTLSQTKLSFRFQSIPGESFYTAPDQTVYVDVETGTAPFTATVSDSWIRVAALGGSEPSAMVSAITPNAVYVTVDATHLPHGTHSGNVMFRSAGRPDREVPIEVTVGPEVALNPSPSSVVLNEDNDYKIPVVVFVTGGANVTFAAAPDTNAQWLSVSPSGASTPYGNVTLAISANTSGLDPGSYSSAVVLTQSGSAGATVRIPVRVDIPGASAGPGALAPAVSAMTFDGVLGVPVPAQTVAVDSATRGASHAFTVSASSEGAWLKAEPFQTTAPASVTVGIDPAAISSPGVYSGEITLTSLFSGVPTSIPVSFIVHARGIAADQTSLTFVGPDVGVAPPPQVLHISANTASAFAITGPSWIRANPASGPTPAAVSITVDPSSLAAGTTNGSLTINGPDNRLTIPVSVTMPAPASVTVPSDTISFSYTVGGTAPTAKVLNVGTTTGKPLQFTVAANTADGKAWLHAQPQSVVAPTTLEVSVDALQLPAGSYTGTISVRSVNGDLHTIPVTLAVGGSPAIQLLLHAASMTPTPICPGLIIAITGSGLGPSTGVNAETTSAGVIATRLGGTRVLFDGIPAPLLYVRFDQVNAIVPYAVYGRASTRVQVETGAGSSTSVDARVSDTAPGIFTAQASGTGQAAALNADMQPNSASNAAPRGGIVILFGTGAGQSDPPGEDGRVNGSDLRYPLAPFSATVAGKPAEVVYFGSAPFLVSGVFQANVRIPSDVDVGNIPVRIQVGSANTQTNVTVAVR